MCLDKVYKKVEPTEYGWKVFRIGLNNELYGVYSDYSFKQNEINESVESGNGYIGITKYNFNLQEKIVYYKQGFHFFYSKEDALEYVRHINYMINAKVLNRKDEVTFVVKKIKVYALLVTGDQDSYKVGVCGKLEIVEEEKQKYTRRFQLDKALF